MPQISTQEFERLPLRVHPFLAGVPLHDVWAVDLPRACSGITLDEFLRTASARSQVGCDCCENDCSRKGHLLTRSPVVRALLSIRFFAGRLFGWDREPASTAWKTFATRLTTADRSKSLVSAGTREGLFRVVYHFENEQLLELINRTAHAAALSALVETANAYRFYFGVYVQNVGRFTPVYMALVDPFRKLDRLSVTPAQRPRQLESSIRHRLTTERLFIRMLRVADRGNQTSDRLEGSQWFTIALGQPVRD